MTVAINVYGIPPNITAAKWSKLMQRLGDGNLSEVVGTGLEPSVATGTRLVQVAAGDAIAAGVLAESDSTSTVTLAANSSGQARIDIVALKLDWSGSQTTAGTLVALPGSPGATPVRPAIPRTAGSVWHIPLAAVLVRNGVGQIAASDLTDLRTLTSTGAIALSTSATTLWSNPGNNCRAHRIGRQVNISGYWTRQSSQQSADTTHVTAEAVPEGMAPLFDQIAPPSPYATNRVVRAVLKTDRSLEITPLGSALPVESPVYLNFSYFRATTGL